MASATGIPDSVPGVQADENEPLLGRVGDASQRDGKPLYYNLTIGMSVSFLSHCEDHERQGKGPGEASAAREGIGFEETKVGGI